MNVNDRVKYLREKRGDSQIRVGVSIFSGEPPATSQVKIGRIERNKRDVTAEELYRFASYFGVSPDWLMFGDAAPPRPDGSEPGWTEDLRSLCRDVKLIMESGDNI